MIPAVTNIPLVSIALCTYNGEKFLTEQLDSLVKQTYPNIEIIIVDDCSTDNTLHILNDFVARYSFIKLYVNEHNLGLSKNFEKALNLCQGEYIAISDQDDIWNLNKIEILRGKIEDNILIYAKSITIDSEGNLTHKLSSTNPAKAYSGSDPRAMIIFNFTWGHNIFFRKELIQLTFPLPEGMDYDWQLGFAALNYGHVQFINEVLVKHRRHGENATEKYSRNRRELLKTCLKGALAIENLKQKDFFERMLNLVNAKKTFWNQLKLFIFLTKEMDILFFTSNKSFFSKLNLMRKYL